MVFTSEEEAINVDNKLIQDKIMEATLIEAQYLFLSQFSNFEMRSSITFAPGWNILKGGLKGVSSNNI